MVHPDAETSRRVLVRCGWDVTAAARILDVGRTRLHERLVALDLVRHAS